MCQKCAEHHGKAASHHESATKHHRAAELAYGSGDHKTAAHEAQCACGCASQADEHADKAAKEHVAHHGTSSAPAGKAHGDHAPALTGAGHAK
jgi:hypothetical protein